MSKKIEAELNTGTLFLELLFLLFLGLKLGNVIDWSWWWVFAPIWIPAVAVVFIIGLAFLAALITTPRRAKKEIKEEIKNVKRNKA